MEIGEYVKKWLDDNDISMSELAKRSGVSKAYISMLCKGENPQNGQPLSPSLKMLHKLSKGMGVNILKLTGGNMDEISDLSGDDIHGQKKVLLEMVMGMTEKQAGAALKLIGAAKDYAEQRKL